MRERPIPTLLVAALLLCLTGPMCLAQGDSETILHRFEDGVDAEVPAGIVFDRQWNLYGTTQQGPQGSCDFDLLPGCGTVFEATPNVEAQGFVSWEKKLIYRFQGGDSDGAGSMAPPTVSADGILYGTTVYGGGDGCGGVGCGTVFQLQRDGGQWVETVLYKFTGGSDGGSPESPVILDGAGNIFGTTFNGGLNECVDQGPCGVVYELQRSDTGWTETVLHAFDYKDGQQPVGGLVMDAAGNLYGTTPWGGQLHLNAFEPAGTIFELSPSQSGWSFQVLYRFPAGGGQSFAGLTLDAGGNLYGTTNAGGAHGLGSIFELQRPDQEGQPWTFSTLLSFDFQNGSGPSAGLIFDKAGNLYGTAGDGGNCSGYQQICGVVLELTPSNGVWTERILYTFQGGTDGDSPNTTPVFDPWGNVWGTTPYGGDPNCIPFPSYSGCGIVYRINRNLP